MQHIGDILKFIFNRNITCTNPADCSDAQRTKIVTLGLKLIAKKETDTVNGYISIDHTPNKHVITIVQYDADEEPNDNHQTRFKKPAIIRTRPEIDALL